MAKVLTGAADVSAARAVTRPESMPPERKQPHGTSHTIRRATDARRRARTPSTASPAVGAAAAGRGGAQYRRTVSLPAAAVVIEGAGERIRGEGESAVGAGPEAGLG